MAALAEKGVSPSVVSDQIGRLTFAGELSRATRHLVDAGAAYGTYNVSNGGPATSWADLAKSVFELCGREPGDVTPVTTAEYVGDKPGISPRPQHSTMSWPSSGPPASSRRTLWSPCAATCLRAPDKLVEVAWPSDQRVVASCRP